ncbi:hypothetical protein [Nevskia sp.]|uniref:hypothetical protein n=1 Tax=Nevskia sp. TaxID=1929292 RepID=UPI0025DDA55A|nr:hypothetical protein [Nevskia sp.]
MATDGKAIVDAMDDDPNDDPYQAPRRWVRGDEVASLVKHMGRVIPDSEWRAAVDGRGVSAAPGPAAAAPPDPSADTTAGA